jgi:hypothetical protein
VEEGEEEEELQELKKEVYIHVRYDAAASISGTATDAYELTTALCGAGELVVA